jgi:hypothetical protein
MDVQFCSQDRALSLAELARQNRRFSGTGGVSAEARPRGFQPAFLDTRNGETHLARFADGRLAPCHVLSGLPERLVAQRDDSGEAIRLRLGVIAGFVLAGRFFTREQAAEAMRTVA